MSCPAGGGVFLERLAEAARASLLDEVSATPKPGLVDLLDSGAHRDMDYYTFLASTEAILPFIREMAKKGIDFGQETSKADAGRLLSPLFDGIRPIGIRAEQAMFRATGGVNTHKGIIFSMGLCAAAAGFLWGRNRTDKNMAKANPAEASTAEASTVEASTAKASTAEASTAEASTAEASIAKEPTAGEGTDCSPILSPDAVLATCRAMCRERLLQDFAAIPREAPRTHGELLYVKSGCRGIRGEAADGFPAIASIGLPALRKISGSSDPDAPAPVRPHRPFSRPLPPFQDSAWNRICLQVLLSLMAGVEDSNVLYRADADALTYMWEQSALALESGPFSRERFFLLQQLNREFIRRNLSPGGCADLLSLTLFLWRLERISALPDPLSEEH